LRCAKALDDIDKKCRADVVLPSQRRARARKGATEERSNKKAELIAVMKRAVGDSDAVPRSCG
jgi:hypothetical protein